jgi:hypothetical protein
MFVRRESSIVSSEFRSRRSYSRFTIDGYKIRSIGAGCPLTLVISLGKLATNARTRKSRLCVSPCPPWFQKLGRKERKGGAKGRKVPPLENPLRFLRVLCVLCDAKKFPVRMDSYRVSPLTAHPFSALIFEEICLPFIICFD